MQAPQEPKDWEDEILTEEEQDEAIANYAEYCDRVYDTMRDEGVSNCY